MDSKESALAGMILLPLGGVFAVGGLYLVTRARRKAYLLAEGIDGKAKILEWWLFARSGGAVSYMENCDFELEVDGGVVTRWKVLPGNPNDDQQWLPSLEHHIECFGKPPNQMSGDRGVHSHTNEYIAQERGVKRVILPQPGRKSEARTQHEKQRWFQQGRKWHAGVEGRISVLKRRNQLDRCHDHGQKGFDKWVGWGVIAGNLLVIGRKVAAST